MSRVVVVFALGVLLTLAPGAVAGEWAPAAFTKLDIALRSRCESESAVRVIVQATDAAAVKELIVASGGQVFMTLGRGQSVVGQVKTTALAALAAAPVVSAIHYDRPMHGVADSTAAAVGAKWVAENLGLDGTGVGVAIIDSGVMADHDDLNGRVVHFVDFVAAQPRPYDGYGHGTHVAGIIAGSGYDSGGSRRGIAPGAHLVVLKTLDSRGEGYISNAIAALDYAIEQRAAFNIRAINLSVAAGVYESYRTDPLTLAAQRAVDAGIVVVTAAGNFGRDADGRPRTGGITAPGNAPWVVTVGAANHHGTADRSDDTVAAFSSIGPTAIDGAAKPDLLAPGVGIESAADADSTMFAARTDGRLWGTVATDREPYLSLSGTSMAAPVVTGTIALMLEANPSLSPAAVKAMLQASADSEPGVSRAVQGAGFLNARAAVELARAAAQTGVPGAALSALVRRMQAGAKPGDWIGAADPAETTPWNVRGIRPPRRSWISRAV